MTFKMKEKQLIAAIEKKLKEESAPNNKKPEKTRGVRSIFYNKILDWLESSNLKKITLGFLKIILSLATIYFFFSPETATAQLIKVYEWRSFFVIKSISAIFLILNIETLTIISFNLFKLIRPPRLNLEPIKNNRNDLEISESGLGVYGVPIEIILDQLVNVRTFKIKDVVSLGMTKRNAEKLSARLKSLGVIYKDKNMNNSLVVSDDFSLEEITEALLDQSPTEQIVRDNRLQNIEVQKNSNSPTPSQLFSVSQIA